jgi:uncharacterized integral membrane protein
MLSLTRKQAKVLPAAGPRLGLDTTPAAGQTPSAPGTLGDHVRPFDAPIQTSETRRGHSQRMARRTRLHGYALVAVALFAFVIALAAANTARVKISWLFGTSHVSLVWLILAAAIIGWLLGLVTNAALARRTRAPRTAPRP